ncbi:hypothetical protein [Legionella cincinnatiensis]|uniref:Uncharacterized protein n=1 Tax=Legionella cincinnatiensis TaxID=28085 RepID=A0A378IKI0_9GAMM|nr:hypothetical protein [Legionella cincinnatiensis]KTC83427.1 hypothetical protein Lcin_2114 [Legionella cincinnatiensis]STX35513.1 Uncharacterised protein [Legionella cincinnatiensis]
MWKKIPSNFKNLKDNNKITFLGKRFISDSSYEKSYKLIEKYCAYDPKFWGEIKEAVQKIEHAEKNKSPLFPEDIEKLQQIQHTLLRSYDFPDLFTKFNPLLSTLNKADNLPYKNTPFY